MAVFISNVGVPLIFADTIVSQTEQVTITAVVLGDSVSLNGGTIISPKTSVRFSGEAYPDAIVSVLRNGENATYVKAGKDGLFSVTLEEQYSSTTLYSLFAKDVANNKSLLINYPLVVTAGYLTYLSGIRFPPTISTDKLQVRFGDYLSVGGYAMPGRELQIGIEDQSSGANKIFTLTSSDTGLYNITLPLLHFPLGDYIVYTKYANDTRRSKLVKFIIGDSNIPNANASLNIPGDCNADGVIDLVDFSVLAFWYKKIHPPHCVDVNHDGIVDLIDFSILAFYWTD